MNRFNHTMAKHRKLYILQRDHSVRKSKKDIKTLLSTGVIDDQTEWVLIPIPDTSSTYIAVNGSAILMNTFNYGVIRYRMVLKALRMGMRSYGLEESIYHQYYTVEYPFDTVEELYYGIFNLLYFHYVKNLIGTSDSTDDQWLIEVPDVIIKMTENGKEREALRFITTEEEEKLDAIPFDCRVSDELVLKLANTFGLIEPDSLISSPNIVFFQMEEGERWDLYKTKIDMYSRMKRMGVTNPFSKSIVLLSREEMDHLLMVGTAVSYTSPICLTDFKESDRREMLSVANYFNMPKYDFQRPWYGDENIAEDIGSQAFEFFGPMVLEVFAFNFYGPEDISFFVDTLAYFLNVYREETDQMSSPCNNEGEIEYKAHSGTVLLQFVADVNDIRGTPSDENIVIYTDPYEDELPNIQEFCKILQLRDQM